MLRYIAKFLKIYPYVFLGKLKTKFPDKNIKIKLFYSKNIFNKNPSSKHQLNHVCY